MHYHFSAIRPQEKGAMTVVVLVVLAVAIIAGSLYFFAPRFASIQVDDLKLQLKPGVEVEISVRVTNLTREKFSQKSDQYLSGRILSKTSLDLVQHLDRLSLDDLPPNAQRVFKLPLRAPTNPGTYVVWIDLVKENSYWFGDVGNPFPKLVLEVGAP